jgi:hypothetical protein
MALTNAGCRVEAICPGGHPVARTRAVHRRHAYSAFAPLRSINAAMQLARPDLIIPCDDLATTHLHSLHARVLHLGQALIGTRALIESSLGAPDRYPLIASRSRLLALARAEVIRVPETEVVESLADLKRWLAASDFRRS